MLCKNCGSQIPNNATECPFCLIEINENYRAQIRQDQMKRTDTARHAEEAAARKADSIRKTAHRSQLIAARKVAAARKAEAKAARKAEIARRAAAKAANKAEEARRAEAAAARLLEEVRRADAHAAQKSQAARNAAAAEMLQSPPRGYAVPIAPYDSKLGIPQPQYDMPQEQMLRQYPFEEE